MTISTLLSNQPVLFQSASEILSALRTRRIGAVELLNLHLAQVDKHNGAINSVVARDIEGALSAARQADNVKGAEMPSLHGLPMTIKDTYEVVGMPTTCGLPFLSEHRASNDAAAVAALKRSGAVVFGKTNVPPGAFDWQSYNSVYGVTNNPWDNGRSPGGSSGGSAAAVAAGFSSLELGSDIGGSIRCPAHFCGVYGHKPSWGIVPLQGHIPPLPGQSMKVEMGVGGPLARSALDLELAMDLIVAPDENERSAWRVVIPPSRHERLQNFRVAVWADASAYAVDTPSLAAIQSYAEDIRALGVKVQVGFRPDIDWKASYETYLATLFQLLGPGMPPSVLSPILASAAALPREDHGYPARMARALAMRHFAYLGVVSQREALKNAWREFFTRYDVLICPVMPTVAYLHDHRGDDAADPVTACEARRMIVDGHGRPYFDGLQWPSVATVADLPSTAMPTGRFIDGLPMGVQVIGPYLEDRTPIRFAQLVEREIGGFKPPPAFA